MQSIYTGYKCISCRSEFVLLSEDIKKMAKGRYVACPYCSSKKVKIENCNNSLKECMGHDAYKKVHGALRQVRNG